MDFYGYKIGGTCKEVPQLTGRYGFNVVVNDQSVNGASGTAKDHKSAFLLQQDAEAEGEITYPLITSGNAGYSLGRMCAAWNAEHPSSPRHVLNFVDNSLDFIIVVVKLFESFISSYLLSFKLPLIVLI